MDRTREFRIGFVAASCAIVAAALITPRAACATATFRLERLTPRVMYLDPGASATYGLRITNTGAEAGSAPLLTSFPFPFDIYLLSNLSDSRCGTLYFVDVSPIPPLYIQGIAFDTTSIAPGYSLDCTMTVTRPSDMGQDTALTWNVRDTNPPYSSTTETALIGTLADTSIATRNLDFSIDANGFGHSTIELTVHNGGRATVESQSAGACEDNFGPDFTIDGGGPEGCGSADYSPPCFDYGYGFLIPQLAPGDTRRCLIHLQSLAPYQNPLSFPINVATTQSAIGGGDLFDIDPNNNFAMLFLGPVANDTSLPVPTNGRSAPLLAVLLGIAAGWQIKRRSNRSMTGVFL